MSDAHRDVLASSVACPRLAGALKALRSTPRLKPGWTLLREWHGKTYTVLALEEGFEMAGQRAEPDGGRGGPGISQSYATRLVRLAWLLPDIVDAILGGCQPTNLMASRLLQDTRIPADWQDQRRALDVWSRALVVQSSPWHGGMRYGAGSSRLRPHDRGGPSRDPA
ncbi:DUF2924 domain-containing protein [Roseomonas rosulenta]|uniref:DUF2924 domain-containing protein n=1 Tax=Roseomonas rosulenta TaxID=2748667 RepID=UPI0018DF5B6C|nr:DUF2924 domain-containing protein [Roseomonas rosulenta]